jgi:hypothetical protein
MECVCALTYELDRQSSSASEDDFLVEDVELATHGRKWLQDLCARMDCTSWLTGRRGTLVHVIEPKEECLLWFPRQTR